MSTSNLKQEIQAAVGRESAAYMMTWAMTTPTWGSIGSMGSTALHSTSTSTSKEEDDFHLRTSVWRKTLRDLDKSLAVLDKHFREIPPEVSVDLHMPPLMNAWRGGPRIIAEMMGARSWPERTTLFTSNKSSIHQQMKDQGFNHLEVYTQRNIWGEGLTYRTNHLRLLRVASLYYNHGEMKDMSDLTDIVLSDAKVPLEHQDTFRLYWDALQEACEAYLSAKSACSAMRATGQVWRKSMKSTDARDYRGMLVHLKFRRKSDVLGIVLPKSRGKTFHLQPLPTFKDDPTIRTIDMLNLVNSESIGRTILGIPKDPVKVSVTDISTDTFQAIYPASVVDDFLLHDLKERNAVVLNCHHKARKSLTDWTRWMNEQEGGKALNKLETIGTALAAYGLTLQPETDPEPSAEAVTALLQKTFADLLYSGRYSKRSEYNRMVNALVNALPEESLQAVRKTIRETLISIHGLTLTEKEEETLSRRPENPYGPSPDNNPWQVEDATRWEIEQHGLHPKWWWMGLVHYADEDRLIQWAIH